LPINNHLYSRSKSHPTSCKPPNCYGAAKQVVSTVVPHVLYYTKLHAKTWGVELLAFASTTSESLRFW